jgi:polysaccharide pyruvyl transferase WcaK-like protein
LIAQADVVIGKGGQMFRTRDRSGLVALWLAMFPLTLASRLGIPTAIYGQAFGPFREGAGQRFSAMLLRRIDLVFLRDPRSVAIARQSGLRSARLREIPDTVFGLDWPTPQATSDVAKALELSDVDYIVVTVTDRMAEASLRPVTLEPLGEVVRGLLASGAVERVVVVMHTDGGSTSDAAGSRLFVSLCDDARVTLLEEDLPWQRLTALYAGARCVIGGRVHSNILSILAGTPAFPIDYTADKASDIFGTFGMADRVVWLDRQDPLAVVEKVRTVLQDAQAAREEVHATRTKLRMESREAYVALGEVAAQ